jgi:hypothetical protein
MPSLKFKDGILSKSCFIQKREQFQRDLIDRERLTYKLFQSVSVNKID